MNLVALGSARQVLPPPGRRERFGLRTEAGELLPLHVERWFGEPDEVEAELLARAVGPVLDIGCGPARHTLALLRRGVAALGVDVARTAVGIAEGRGAPAVHRSVFDRLPLEGTWGTALLLDGNAGIGGEPARLLARMQAVLRPGGRVLAEVEPPGAPTGAGRVAVEDAGRVGPWFPWGRVGADGVSPLAEAVGLALIELWTGSGRWFAHLEVPA